MRVGGHHYRTIWTASDRRAFMVIGQTKLPHSFETARIESAEQAADAIRTMVVRGAPLIGATAAYGLWLALQADPTDRALDETVTLLLATRPTAVNLCWALDRVRCVVAAMPPDRRADAALAEAEAICGEDVRTCEAIGRHGLALLRTLAESRGAGPLNILTHRKAGWLATVDRGTALAPVYLAHDGGIPVHVWVDETRPRSQGARLTAWELLQHGVPHTVITDSSGGHLMQHGPR